MSARFYKEPHSIPKYKTKSFLMKDLTFIYFGVFSVGVVFEPIVFFSIQDYLIICRIERQQENVRRWRALHFARQQRALSFASCCIVFDRIKPFHLKYLFLCAER